MQAPSNKRFARQGSLGLLPMRRLELMLEHALAVSKLSIICHWDSGALAFISWCYIGGTIRYQPTNTSTAAWRGFMALLYQTGPF